MEVFAPRPGRPIAAFGSEGLAFEPVARSTRWAAVSILRVAPGGRVGGHEAPVPQVARVLEGEGTTRTRDAQAPLAPGVVVRWAQGEWHETEAGAKGLLLLVVESPEFEPPLDV